MELIGAIISASSMVLPIAKAATKVEEKALKKARTLAFWERHGLQATIEAFGVGRRALFGWKKKLKEANGKFEGLNDKSKGPKTKRKRLWPIEIIAEIKRLRWEHPNLGKEKMYPELKEFCDKRNFVCPKPKDFKAEYPGHCVALDTVEKIIDGKRYYRGGKETIKRKR